MSERSEPGVRPLRCPRDVELHRDRRLALSLAAASTRLTALGIHDQALLLALEGCVGGLWFDAGRARVQLGLRFADERAVTPDGRPLARWAVEGDMSYYATDAGEVWTRDAVADRAPHWQATDLLGFATAQRWPIVDALAPLRASLGE